MESLEAQQEPYLQGTEENQEGKITVTYRQLIWILASVFFVSNLVVGGFVALGIGIHYQKKLISRDMELLNANEKIKALKDLEDEILRRLPKKKEKPAPTSTKLQNLNLSKRVLAKKLAVVILFEYMYKQELQRLELYEILDLITVESAFDIYAISDKGAMGLMQLMPATAKNQGVIDPFDPEQNIKGGLRYLAYLLRKYNSKELALMAYYTGETALNKHLRNRDIPDNLVEYVLKVLKV